MVTRYVAIRGQFPIRVDFKTNVTQSVLGCYIHEYGLDFIGLYETFEQALNDIMINEMFIDSLNLDDLEHQPSTDDNTIFFLENCWNLEYNGGV